MATIRANVPLQFGLVSVPVNIVSAVKDAKEEISLNMVCDGNEAPHTICQINSVFRCPLCKNEDKEKMKKGRNMGGGAFVLVSEEEAAKTVLGKDDDAYKAITLNVHPSEDVVGVTPAGSFYYLAPTAASGASYNLFVRMLKENPEYTLLTQWAIKTKLAIYRLLVVDDVLAIEKLAWPEDVHPLPAAPPLPVPDKMMEQAKMLLAMTVTPFDLLNYRDERRAGLASWIAAQNTVEGIASTDKPTAKVTTNSLEEQLAEMLAAAQSEAAVEVKAKTKAKTTKAKTKVVEATAESKPVEATAKKRAPKVVTPKG